MALSGAHACLLPFTASNANAHSVVGTAPLTHWSIEMLSPAFVGLTLHYPVLGSPEGGWAEAWWGQDIWTGQEWCDRETPHANTVFRIYFLFPCRLPLAISRETFNTREQKLSIWEGRQDRLKEVSCKYAFCLEQYFLCHNQQERG